jgi:E1A-binding protein p400
MTIEEALSAGLASRESKKLVTDYTRVQLADEALYGESTASDSGSDASYEPEDEGFDDDETTFLQAEQEELLERRLMQSDDESDAESFRADPIELRKLQEEGSMDIEKVIQRLRNDGLEAKSDEELELQPATKQVKFSSPIEVRDVKPAVASCRADPGEEADDDADASDVEDFVGDGADDDEEFVADQEEADDETTIEAEERLPREISVEAEIALLQSESELPIEELLRRFSRPDGEVAADTRDFSSLQQPALHDLFYTQQVDDDQENDEEFEPDLSARDDETTMEEEEQLGREMTAEAELAILKEDSEIPLDALRAMYAGVPSSRNSSSRKCEGEDMEEEEDGDEASIAGEAAFQALEASAEKARTTLATRPFLLSPSVHLREYQQIGLNWLVSLQSRRLNGILADEMVSRTCRIDWYRQVSHSYLCSNLLGTGENTANDIFASLFG